MKATWKTFLTNKSWEDLQFKKKLQFTLINSEEYLQVKSGYYLFLQWFVSFCLIHFETVCAYAFIFVINWLLWMSSFIIHNIPVPGVYSFLLCLTCDYCLHDISFFHLSTFSVPMCKVLNYVLLKFICWSPKPHCDCIWR